MSTGPEPNAVLRLSVAAKCKRHDGDALRQEDSRSAIQTSTEEKELRGSFQINISRGSRPLAVSVAIHIGWPQGGKPVRACKLLGERMKMMQRPEASWYADNGAEDRQRTVKRVPVLAQRCLLSRLIEDRKRQGRRPDSDSVNN